MTSLSRLLTGTAALAALALAAPAIAFELDSRFVDNDGDLVADIPTDESALLDPETLIFTYTPVEDPAVYEGVWQGFMDHLSEATGKDVQFFPVDSNAAQLEAMRAGRLHIAGFNTGSNPIAVACAGFRPFAMMAAEDDSFGYEMEIIVPADSEAESVEDLRGGEITFTQETSNSGFKAPSAILASEFDMVANEDFTPAFSGSHDTSILGVANGDYESASIANSVKARMIEREVIAEDDVKVIYQSQTFPTTGYGTVYNLTPELQEQIRDAFFSFDWEGSALQEEFANSGEAKFIEISFQDDWSVIRQIDEANGVSYACQ
ncbi:phosphate/phosphite/phosphonate ABC transporter substrate-binding protein [Pelagibacterium montanilacus]|uniref:phosphate/phosphite/phosphonate ABC transporter substrate-binding protein n=1 Tax=Pelagibacterium montanilacus TaxID=2185280 RepID=UPI000F8E9DB2|nr:phosphate/phosphite/phosphonate ABC transporter substrate-binding protein [Pelagibacterium montanilacus]